MRHAICNEMFQSWDFAGAAKFVRSLAESPSDIAPARRVAYRDILNSEGLAFVGLHWLMVSPKGLHVTTPDKPLRDRSWQHIRDLIDLCADLGPKGVMVFGSPVQRSTVDGSTVPEATARYIEGLSSVAPQAQDRGVTILVEALPVGQANVVNTLAEASSIVRQIASPAIQTMFDTHNAVDETEPHATLVEKYFEIIRHVHVNEMDGRHPGMGDYDFKPILKTLDRLGYQGWVSLEAFDFSFGAEKIARESIEHLNGEMIKQE
jgi:D-psicose/D-tagatose/L-ribulose 3-epimerase